MIRRRREKKGKVVTAVRDARRRCCKHQRIQKDKRGGRVFKYQHRRRWVEGPML